VQLLCSFSFKGSQYHNFHQVFLINKYKFIHAISRGLRVSQINLTPAVQVRKYQHMNKSLINLHFCRQCSQILMECEIFM
jgi:hypothetical protein